MLQFAPDCAAVTRQMRRVLAPGGRAAISVWADITQNPAQQQINDAIIRHAGSPGVMPGLAFSTAGELEGLFAGAGFGSATVELATKDARFPEPEHVARRWLLAASAGIPSFHQLDGPARDALLETIAAELTGFIQDHTVDGHVVFPWTAFVAIAEA